MAECEPTGVWARANPDHPIVKALIRAGCTLDEIPDGVQRIGLDRPPENVFEHFRRLHGIEASDGE